MSIDSDKYILTCCRIPASLGKMDWRVTVRRKDSPDELPPQAFVRRNLLSAITAAGIWMEADQNLDQWLKDAVK